MDPRRLARRELTILAVVVLALSRVTSGPALVLVMILIVAMLVTGALVILAEGEPAGVPIESLMPVAAAGIAAASLVRLVPVGALLVLALGAAALLVHVTVGLEARLAAQPRSPDERDRRAVLWVALVICLVAFAGLPAAVADVGLDRALAPLAVPMVEGLVAALLGYRLAALRRPDLRAAAFSALSYGTIVALAGQTLRVLDLPPIVVPPLLVLVFYLWDAVHATEPARRQGRRWLLELGVLGLLGILVIVFASRP